MSAIKQQCANPEIGRLLDDAITDALLIPDREPDRHLFFDLHLGECPACHDAMLHQANELAIIELASERQVDIEDVLDSLSELAIQLQEAANREGLTLAEALEITLNEKRRRCLTVNQY